MIAPAAAGALRQPQRLPLGLDVAQASDSARDYERSFRQTQRVAADELAELTEELDLY